MNDEIIKIMNDVYINDKEREYFACQECNGFVVERDDTDAQIAHILASHKDYLIGLFFLDLTSTPIDEVIEMLVRMFKPLAKIPHEKTIVAIMYHGSIIRCQNCYDDQDRFIVSVYDKNEHPLLNKMDADAIRFNDTRYESPLQCGVCLKDMHNKSN